MRRRWQWFVTHVLRRGAVERALDEEIRAHLRLDAEQRMATGQSADDAWSAARRQFGNVAVVKDVTRDMWGWRWTDELATDLRVSARALAKTPRFTVVGIVTLGLSITTTAVVLSTVDRAFWRRLPLPNAKALFTLARVEESSSELAQVSNPTVEAVQDLSEGVFGVAAIGHVDGTMVGDGAPVRLPVGVVSGSYFGVLGIRPTIGRTLTPLDDQTPGAHPVVVLTEQVWRDHFAADARVLGRALLVEAQPYTVVGVAASPLTSRAHHPALWISRAMSDQLMPGYDLRERRNSRFFTVVGRLADDATLAQASAIGDVAAERVQARNDASAPPSPWRLAVLPINRLRVDAQVHEQTTQFLAVVVTMTIGFLLAACGNLVLLFLTRRAERARELALRALLGAGTARLFRLVASEVLVVAALAAGLAFVTFQWMEPMLGWFPQVAMLELAGGTDLRALAIVCIVASAAGLLTVVGLSLSCVSRDPFGGLRLASGYTATGRMGVQQTLVVIQVGLSCVLLVSMGLLLQSARAVGAVPVGFARQDVLVAQLHTPVGEYAAEDGQTLYRRLQAALEREPAVDSVSLAWHAPLSRMFMSVFLSVPGSPVPAEQQIVPGNVVSRRYFETLGVPVEGREFSAADGAGSELVVMVNRAFANRFWPDQPAIGREVRLSRNADPRRVIGVVDDIRYRELDETVQPIFYFPMGQRFMNAAYVHVRTRSVDPRAMTPILRERVAALDPRIALHDIHTLEERRQALLNEWRGPAGLASVIAAVTFILTVAALYAVVAGAVARRKREIAIRLALGAQPRQVLRAVRWQGLRLVGLGMLMGVPIAVVLAAYLEDLLFGVVPRDLPTFAVVLAIVTAATWPACQLPAYRVSRVDPMSALRAE